MTLRQKTIHFILFAVVHARDFRSCDSQRPIVVVLLLALGDEFGRVEPKYVYIFLFTFGLFFCFFTPATCLRYVPYETRRREKPNDKQKICETRTVSIRFAVSCRRQCFPMSTLTIYI